MVALLLKYKITSGIRVDMYYKNRSILAGRTAGNSGRWSARWAEAVLKWQAHCIRAHDGNMWRSSILNHHDASWLERQRLEHSTGVSKKLEPDYVPVKYQRDGLNV